MRPLRALGPRFRIVIAALFGFMSLAHGPVMAFAKEQATQAHHQPAAHHMAQHVGHTLHQSDHFQQEIQAPEHGHHHGAASICYASGCFIAVAPVPASAPDNIPSPLQQLRPATAQAIVPAELDPSDPPPRLPV